MKIYSVTLTLILLMSGLALSAPEPPTPPDLTYQTIGKNLSVIWTAVPNADGYILSYVPYPYNGHDVIQTVDVGDTTNFNAELWDGAAYMIAVQAYNNHGNSSYSNIENFTLEITPPETPELSYSMEGAVITISWTSVENIDGYLFSYSPSPYQGEETITTRDMGGSNSIQYTLPSGSAFFIAVQAYNEGGVSPYSNFEEVTAEVEDIDNDGDGFTAVLDCNDNDQSINPSSEEICGDGIDQDCSGEDQNCIVTSGSYTDNGNGTVTDSSTGLIWQQSDDNLERTWQESIDYCNGLTLGGSSNWRLPVIAELEGLVEMSVDPPIDSIFIVNSNHYWSSTYLVDHPEFALLLHLHEGDGGVNGIEEKYSARCVKGDVSAPINENGVIPSKALSLDGYFDKLWVPHSESLDISESKLTMEAWVQITGDTGNHWIVSKQLHDPPDSFNRSYGFYIASNDSQNSRKIYPSIQADWHFEEPVGDGTLEYDQWYHVAVVYDGNSVKTYINGQLNGEASLTGELVHNLKELTIGGTYWTPTDTTNGLIGEVRIWNIARAQSDIQSTMGVPLSGNEIGLVGYWQFNTKEDLGVNNDGLDDVRDLSGNSNHGDLVGDADI